MIISTKVRIVVEMHMRAILARSQQVIERITLCLDGANLT